ncbi:MAG: isochorismate synthase [Armatimonadota bacterium]|nr:isochorismate synthase [Armatimonadota bacterium]MDR7519910.1 isochorismate synthase [Armatimonadota bacterium]MDR7548510.1 isochorismate synthase [Armatimonadota bacterium]
MTPRDLRSPAAAIRLDDSADPGAGLHLIGPRLRGAAAAARRRAAALQRPVVAWTGARAPLTDPLDLLALEAVCSHDPVLFARPEESFSLLGIGTAWEFSGSGPDRFARARLAWEALVEDAVGETVGDEDLRGAAPAGAADAWGAGPVLAGGFSFVSAPGERPPWAGFPEASLRLPRVAVAAVGGACWVTLAVVVQPDASAAVIDDEVDACLHLVEALAHSGTDRAVHPGALRGNPPRAEVVCEELPPAEVWKATVASAARAVRNGTLEKVVVARALWVRGGPFDPADTLRRLRDGYPTCTLFAVIRDGRCFLGATPERLVRVRGGQVSAMALAGSAPRGATEDEDRRLGEMLLASPKDRLEHAVVVDVLRDALAEMCGQVTVAASPSLFKVANVQHLVTPISARRQDRATVLDLVGRMHPTPAVGGVPRDDALAWLCRHEGLDRGWYAGPVGWMNRSGEGEFAVAIRSALLHPGGATLFTGCGIVADSDPDQEYAESCLKLRPMLAALGAGGA